MTINTLFKPQAGSPTTTLVSSITDTATEIEVTDVSVLPDSPNMLTMVDGDNFESVIYENVDSVNNLLQNVTRGVEGTAQAWNADQEIARYFTAKDLSNLQYWVKELISGTELSEDKNNEIVSFTSAGINEDTLEIYEHYTEFDLNITWGNQADTITEINIEGTTVIDPSNYSVSGSVLTVQAQPLFDYGGSELSLNIEFNDGFVVDNVSISILVTVVESDEGTIMSETTLVS